MSNMENFFKSRLFTGILVAVGMLIILMVDFRAGVLVGYRRAVFSEQWGENYERNFIGPTRPGMMGFSGKVFLNAYGVSGTVIKVASTSIIVRGEGADTSEKLVNISDDTAIRRFQDMLKISDIKAGDKIIVVGSPNESGQIEAKLIRIVPVATSQSATSTKQ